MKTAPFATASSSTQASVQSFAQPSVPSVTSATVNDEHPRMAELYEKQKKERAELKNKHQERLMKERGLLLHRQEIEANEFKKKIRDEEQQNEKELQRLLEEECRVQKRIAELKKKMPMDKGL